MHNLIAVSPGDPVVTEFNGFQHWSLASDAISPNGLPFLISATKRNGTVQEEPWDVVTKGRHTYVAALPSSTSAHERIANARSQIGQWQYSVFDRNCEHFINWVHGLPVSSKQVVSGVSGAVVGASVVGLVAENPNALKLIGGAVVVGGLALLAAKAIEKQAA